MSTNNLPIGVFDSGLGGLTVVKSIFEQLPFENIVYFGDTARVPYGDRSKETILEYVKQDIDFLMYHRVKAVVIACNTADAIARPEMEKLFNIPIIGVVGPAGKKAAFETKNNKIGVIGTNATVKSNAYDKVIAEYNANAKVFSAACPLLVPLVEEGRVNKGDIVTETVLRDYLLPLKAQGVDTIILGCTHYPLLYDMVTEIMPGVNIICSGAASTESLIKTLNEFDIVNSSPSRGSVEFYVSDAPEAFAENGGLFIGRHIRGCVSKVNIENF